MKYKNSLTIAVGAVVLVVVLVVLVIILGTIGLLVFAVNTVVNKISGWCSGGGEKAAANDPAETQKLLR